MDKLRDDMGELVGDLRDLNLEDGCGFSIEDSESEGEPGFSSLNCYHEKSLDS